MNRNIKTHKEVDKYIKGLRELAKEDPETVKIIAKVALIKTGVLNEDGSSKGNIVDYPHSLTYEFENMPKRRIRK